MKVKVVTTYDGNMDFLSVDAEDWQKVVKAAREYIIFEYNLEPDEYIHIGVTDVMAQHYREV